MALPVASSTLAWQRSASVFKRLQHHSPPLPVHDSGLIKNVIYLKNNAAAASPPHRAACRATPSRSQPHQPH
ncbi:hypothetical protein XFPR_03125 [Xylella fastidiosa]|uniref:hypothetical protein n=1 Tax=Xylella fastidiosa TaxID=2371 RepID=UPI0003D2F6C3|nr:hypothetical protein [Xylella fastidiosa]ALR03775.1 hypothetical protein XFPR_03125 [Xylella fastidiosa]KXB22147.1 hypothetical protein ADT30_01925 [Xylella fastidiosa]OJZ71739.1 hypothetical protein B375_0203070 [Xylella fastidiosa 6c]